MSRHQVHDLLRSWRVTRYQHRQLADSLRLERSVLNARMADQRLAVEIPRR
jgi:hypothetical protein